MSIIAMATAENQAFDEELARDETVFIMGEDIGEHWGGPFGQFKGLAEKYGTERIRETPISETAILGGAIGAAATGMRPIAYLMFADFFGVAGDEFLNQLQMRYMYGGKVKLPLTIVAGTGAGHKAAAQHSKTMYGWLATIQGLKVVAPSTPRDAKGLLKSAIREDNPVVYLSHKMVSYLPAEVEDEDLPRYGEEGEDDGEDRDVDREPAHKGGGFLVGFPGVLRVGIVDDLVSVREVPHQRCE